MEKAAEKAFWQTKTLAEMSDDEWESLCDGCAQCCQLKFEIQGDPEYVVAPIVCKLLNIENCRCTHYKDRHQLVSDCVQITPENIDSLFWLPETCGYRLVAEGKPLYDWHPLIVGDSSEMRRLGISVSDRVVSERDVHPDDIEIQVLRWVSEREQEQKRKADE